MDFWEKTNGTFGVLDISTKHLCEKKMNFFWVYMPFNIEINLCKEKNVTIWAEKHTCIYYLVFILLLKMKS